ncbi:MAG: 23S rRNA (uracil(1939)-C(5))-methyltransferase RlmD [Tannerellaceae bacterium]|nr:23S rRNA (uracil(1939)-C(5))-methyltransferase RlmD [Tannerellaceae bacterium]
MTRKQKILPTLKDVLITGVGAEGKAIARDGEMVIFVSFGAPGDVADIKLLKKKSNYAEGKIVAVNTPSPVRETPFCNHFSICGGCRWQHLRYDEQLKSKASQVEDSLRRIGKVEIGEIRPIIASSLTQRYRNKLEYTFTSSRWLTEDELADVEIADRNGLGFHIPGRFDKVLDIHNCYLQDDISNRIRIAIKNYCLSHDGYDFFDLRSQQGFMRNLIIRNSATTGELMIILVFAADDRVKRDALLDFISGKFEEITSIFFVINTKCNDNIADLEAHLFKGNEYITERMDNLFFRICPKSFYQTNSLQAYQLYKVVRDFASLEGHETIYDLYTGAGTIACFLADKASRVIGIEYVEQAVEDARANAALNNIGNATFFSGDMKDILTEGFIAEQGYPDVIVTDPPRAGMHTDVIKAILFSAPARIVYVSCNPATQARDLALLAVDYEVCKIQPVDMFPHTHHVENVALLIRRTFNEA